MTCRRCPEGRRYAPGSVYCRIYGMILTEEHECRRRAGKAHEEAGEYRVEDAAVALRARDEEEGKNETIKGEKSMPGCV